MTRKILPLALLSGLAAAAALLTARGGRSRESLLPALRAVQGEEKTLERLAGRALPVSVAEERRIGEAFDARVPRPADERSRAWEARLAELGGELSRSPSNRRLRRRYVFRVIAQDGSANAFTVAGGFVYVTAGLMRRVERDDDALRFVLGHEIGHSELGHCADAHRLEVWAGKAGLGALGSAADLARDLAALHYSEVQELEADAYSVRLLRELRRPPRAALRALDLLGIRDERASALPDPVGMAVDGVLDYPRTHPGGWERRAALERAG